MSLVGLTKVKARKSFLFTEGYLKVENKEHLFDFVVTLLLISLLGSKQNLMLMFELFPSSNIKECVEYYNSLKAH